MVRIYVLTAEDYAEAVRILRKLRKKKAFLHKVLIIASVDDHRKIKDSIAKGQQAIIILVK